jgi:hypothetical protein
MWLAEFQTNIHFAAAPAPVLEGIGWPARIPGAEDHTEAVVCFYVADPLEQIARCTCYTNLRKPI